MFVCAFEQFNGRSVTRNQVTKKGVKKVSDMMSNGLTTNGALIIGSYLMLLVYRFFCDLFLLIKLSVVGVFVFLTYDFDPLILI